MEKKYFLKTFLVFKSLISLIYLNFLILYSKIFNKKIFFFYYPKKLVTGVHTFVIEDLFYEYTKNSTVIFGHQANHLKLNKNYVYIKESFLEFLFGVDFFISSYICDKFIKKSKKIYINHHIYDSPMVSPEKEKKMCERLSSYEVIFVASKNLENFIKNLFERYKKENDKIQIPKLIEIGYPRYDYLYNKMMKIENKDKNSVLISPTNFDSDPNFSLHNNLNTLIKNLIDNTDFNIIFRPHPSNRLDLRVSKLVDNFKNAKRFHYDESDDYTQIYSKSFCMIADHSDTAYMFPFLTLCPVIFYSNKNLESFINSNDTEIKSYDYKNLNYFKNRDKIGIVINDVNSIVDKINLIKKKQDAFKNNIISIRNEITYLGSSKNRFYEEMNRMSSR